VEAFIGLFSDHHRFLLTTMLARVDALRADIAAVEKRTETVGPIRVGGGPPG
jgi:hypothetical protein